jgi:hypothetical protein
VAWGWLVGDGDAIDLRVEVLILVVGENLTKEENETVETAGQIKVSTSVCLEYHPTKPINLLRRENALLDLRPAVLLNVAANLA